MKKFLQRSMTLLMCLMLVVGTAGCAAGNKSEADKTETAGVTVSENTTGAADEAVAPVDSYADAGKQTGTDDSTVTDNSADNNQSGTAETNAEPEEEPLSEEGLYWMGVAEELSGRYDLTAALTGPALKDLCQNYFMLGVGINGSSLDNQTLNIPEYMAVAKKHFNSCTMTNLMKSGYILRQAESKKSEDGSPALSFETIDPTLQWCMDNGMKMRGHTLVWHAQAPDWFFREGYENDTPYVDKDTMLFRMESYIKQMLNHVQDNYPGVIYCWDVVNEAVDPDKGDKDSGFMCRMENDGQPNPWYITIGPEYVEKAFTFARQYAAEDVKLFYNDFNTFQIPKTKAIYALCKDLRNKGLIDGIGMQGYWGISYPSYSTIETAILEFAKLKLEIQITELSIDIDEETPALLEKQGKAYGMIFHILKNLDKEAGGPANITCVTLFGLVDHYREGDATKTRIFDKDYQPKLGFDKMKAVMSRWE